MMTIYMSFVWLLLASMANQASATVACSGCRPVELQNAPGKLPFTRPCESVFLVNKLIFIRQVLVLAYHWDMREWPDQRFIQRISISCTDELRAAAIKFLNGTLIDVAHIKGTPTYLAAMKQLAEAAAGYEPEQKRTL